MASRAPVGVGFPGLFACGCLLLGAWTGQSADLPLPVTTNLSGTEPPAVMAPDFREQQDVIQQAIEQTRSESEAAARRNAEALTQGLTFLLQSLEAQHRRELEVMQNSNRTTLLVAGVLAGVGFLGMFCLAFFLMRATNRLTEMAMAVPLSHALGPGPSPNALTAGDSHLVASPVELAGARFLGAIEQLEKRLHELEHTTPQTPIGEASNHPNGQPKPESETDPSVAKPDSEAKGVPDQHRSSTARESAADSSHAARVALVLAKGDTLLNLDKPGDALACFDEAVALDPQNADALVKKGTALEKLRRMDEAIACYDRAIAANSSLTTAYLYKGGAFNRLQRYEEALKCYEQALQTGQKALA